MSRKEFDIDYRVLTDGRPCMCFMSNYSNHPCVCYDEEEKDSNYTVYNSSNYDL